MGSPRTLFVWTTDQEMIYAERWTFLAQRGGAAGYTWDYWTAIGNDSLFYYCTQTENITHL